MITTFFIIAMELEIKESEKQVGTSSNLADSRIKRCQVCIMPVN